MTLASCSGLIIQYDRTTGTRRWTYDVKQDGPAQSFHGEMTRHGDDLLVAADPEEGHVYRLGAEDGSLRWKWPSGSGVSSDLRVFDDALVVVTLYNELIVLDATTGEERWATEPVEGQRIAPITSTPLRRADTLLFGRADGRLSLHDLPSGDLLWTSELGAGTTTDLADLGGRAAVGLADGRLVRLSADGRIEAEARFDEAPSYRWFPVEDLVVGLTGVDGPGRRVAAVRALDWSIAWETAPPTGDRWTVAQPALHEGRILVGSNAPAVIALEAATGAVLWTAPTDEPPRTITATSTHLYVGTVDGRIYAYRLP